MDELEFSQEEKQIIWDALYQYMCVLHGLTQSDHPAKDDFAKDYNICVNLVKEKLDKYWDIIH